ncbi:hypothetical protein C5167_013012 [Papaver somniferum]|uniref:Uncharacterized protein n=1 Tax=Papaver somniferum TaxID=3469 RepID=A0A4Y7J332_PAPSO|nr:hypothetical protein C5167_013012 [Papaver somniferum]
MKRGLKLFIRHGKPEHILPSIAKAFGAHTVKNYIYAHIETCSKEMLVERLVKKGCKEYLYYQRNPHPPVEILQILLNPSVQFVYASNFHHKLGHFPTTTSAELGDREMFLFWTSLVLNKGMYFAGGGSAALGRVYEFFWKKDLIKVYKHTGDVMLGPYYSTKFSNGMH